MAEFAYPPEIPDVSHLPTEDDAPVDNFVSEKQQRLLTETLYTSWSGPPAEEGDRRVFLAAANVGYYATVYDQSAIVPDVMVSADVELPPDWIESKRKCYMLWQFGKQPDLAIEIVSNAEGEELGAKLRRYARLRFPYYSVYDPMHYLGETSLSTFALGGHIYRKLEEPTFPDLGLKLKLWTGTYERCHATWLRWETVDGELLLTGEEQRQRAEEQRQRAESAERETERLRDLLRKAGIEPPND